MELLANLEIGVAKWLDILGDLFGDRLFKLHFR